jgi:hypothetical protein
MMTLIRRDRIPDLFRWSNRQMNTFRFTRTHKFQTALRVLHVWPGALLVFLLVAHTPCFSQITTYTNRTAWQAVATGGTTISFAPYTGGNFSAASGLAVSGVRFIGVLLLEH